MQHPFKTTVIRFVVGVLWLLMSLTLHRRRTFSYLYLDALPGGLTAPLFIITSRIWRPLTEEPYLIIGFSSGLGVCERVFVPVLIRIYATGPRFAVASCIAHYRYLPRGCELKHETNSELCAAKCAQEISQARKLGCVRGVNLRLSQPEATIGCRKDAIFGRGLLGCRVGNATWWHRDISCDFIKETELLEKRKSIIDLEDRVMLFFALISNNPFMKC